MYKSINYLHNNFEMKEKKNKKHGSIIWLMSVSFIAVGLLLFCQFYFGDGLSEKTTFYENTHINGVNVSGMTQKEAENVVSSKMLENRSDIEITLTSGQQKWVLKGDDFEVKSDLDAPISKVLSYGREGNVFAKKKVEKDIKNKGLNVNISYKNVLGGVDEKLEEIIQSVESQGMSPNIIFEPDKEEMFSISETQKGLQVNRDEFFSKMDAALETASSVTIDIPTTEVVPSIDKEAMLKQIKLRSSFKTSYATSSADRKNNVKKALSMFNGMVVGPGQEVSFNNTTGPRTVENGYKKANIIMNGVYVAGAGGGVCQASTTLYNALILADVEILQANHHSLPASYVPLSFDAMVSEGYSDLVFKNNLTSPLYIKTFCDESYANVEIYGLPLEEGHTIRTRAEFVKVIPHTGDKIVADKNGEYSNYVLYKGEYHRLKYPREGYESKGYVQYLKDGEVVNEKMIRHDFYWPQNGVIIEGEEEIGEGMYIPPSDVKIIPAQKITEASSENIKNKLEKTNPSAYNP